MLCDDLTITGTLEVLSPVHPGSGWREAETSEGAPEPETALVARGADGSPVLPASSLKGVLRAALAGDGALCETVFGVISEHEEGHGATGRLWLRTATLAPRGKGAGARVERRPRTAISRRTGAADDHKLFRLETVEAGAAFRFAAVWCTEADLAAADDVEVGQIAAALAPLARGGGWPVGRGGSRLGGRVRLAPESLRATWNRLDAATGVLGPDAASAAVEERLREALVARAGTLAAAEGRAVTLTLSCDGPYISIDPHRGESGDNVIRAARTPDGKPVLHASSLLGALRSRAAWIAECERAAGKSDDCRFAPGRHPDWPMDDRDLDHVMGRHRAVRSRADVAKLSSVERLFGVSGWRGRVVVDAVRIQDHGAPVRLPGVGIDRFTGGAREGMLYQTEVFPGVTAKAELRVDPSPRLTAADDELLELLWTSLRSDCLYLGHGAARGYGWFEVAVAGDVGEARL